MLVARVIPSKNRKNNQDQHVWKKYHLWLRTTKLDFEAVLRKPTHYYLSVQSREKITFLFQCFHNFNPYLTKTWTELKLRVAHTCEKLKRLIGNRIKSKVKIGPTDLKLSATWDRERITANMKLNICRSKTDFEHATRNMSRVGMYWTLLSTLFRHWPWQAQFWI